MFRGFIFLCLGFIAPYVRMLYFLRSRVVFSMFGGSKSLCLWVLFLLFWDFKSLRLGL